MGGMEGEFRVSKLAIEDGTDFEGVVFGLDEEVASGRFGGEGGTVSTEEVHGHVPECWNVFVWLFRGWRGLGEAWACEVDVGEEVVGGEGEFADRTKAGPAKGGWVWWREEALEI